MIASIADKLWRRTALAALLVAAFVAGDAAGQVGAPVPLGPRPAPAAPDAPAPALPAAPVAVVAQPLAEVDPESVGLLDEGAGGLGVDLWAGIDRATLVRLLPLLPVATPSAVVNGLSRRLLVSIAKAPPAMPAVAPGALVRARAGRLLAAGESLAAAELIRLGGSDEGLARIVLDGLLDAADPAAACARVLGPGAPMVDPYWQKARVFCQAVGGERAGARIGRDLLLEAGEKADPVFFTLAEALLEGGGTAPASLPRPTALERALLRATGLVPPADLGQDRDPASLRLVALSPQVRGERRLAAAEAALGLGAITAADLGKAYAAEAFTPAELTAWAGAPATPRGRALRYQAARQAPTPAARVPMVAAALHQGAAGADVTALARVYLDAGLIPVPLPEALPLAGVAVRAHLAAGGLEAARGWRGLLAVAAVSGNAEARGALALVRPLLFLAGDAETELAAADLAAWAEAARAASPDGFAAQAAVLYTLLDNQDVTIPAEQWRPLIGVRPPPPAAIALPLWYGLAAAVAEDRKGEALLLALLSLDAADPRRTHGIVLARVVEALRGIGHATEARALVLEAALAAGL
ncbi:MAG: hypothetical protein EXQ96_08470 [Alphaproteobacteria bacterium]|nr:hypothetical protein [Alphaproteobacteria bacterium]